MMKENLVEEHRLIRLWVAPYRRGRISERNCPIRARQLKTSLAGKSLRPSEFVGPKEVLPADIKPINESADIRHTEGFDFLQQCRVYAGISFSTIDEQSLSSTLSRLAAVERLT